MLVQLIYKGFISKWADVIINDSIIHENSKGGILIQSHKLNEISVNNYIYFLLLIY